MTVADNTQGLDARQYQLLRERQVLHQRIGYLRRLGAAATPPVVEGEPMDIAQVAGLAMRRRAEGFLAADELWALAGKRRHMAELAAAKADINQSIARLESQLAGYRNRLATLEQEAATLAATIAALEHGLATHTDDVRELMSMVPKAHLHNARLDEARARAKLHADYEEARAELAVVNRELAALRGEGGP